MTEKLDIIALMDTDLENMTASPRKSGTRPLSDNTLAMLAVAEKALNAGHCSIPDGLPVQNWTGILKKHGASIGLEVKTDKDGKQYADISGFQVRELINNKTGVKIKALLTPKSKFWKQ